MCTTSVPLHLPNNYPNAPSTGFDPVVNGPVIPPGPLPDLPLPPGLPGSPFLSDPMPSAPDQLHSQMQNLIAMDLFTSK